MTATKINNWDGNKRAVIQIATPYSTGTGFYLDEYKLVVTNEHIIRDNKEVVMIDSDSKKQLAKVVYIDVHSDLAFLLPSTDLDRLPTLDLCTSPVAVGGKVVSIGHPIGQDFSVTAGIITSINHQIENIQYLRHDASLSPENSGGPLFNTEGKIIGVNTFFLKEGKSLGISLPCRALHKALQQYSQEFGTLATRCTSCSTIAFEESSKIHCLTCGASLNPISAIEVYEPQGINKSLEHMIQNLGYDIRLSRTGPNSWSIVKGSAHIHISYHEKSGLITGDAHLCRLPENQVLKLYSYLLSENYKLEGLTFSVKGQDIILSLLIYDQYFSIEVAERLFSNLFDLSDHYDDVLIDTFSALWIT